MADQEPVVEHAVGHVHQQAEVRAGRDLPGSLAALQQGAQRRAYFESVAAVTPARRVGRPDDVAGAGYVTGTVLECTGGSNLTAAALAG